MVCGRRGTYFYIQPLEDNDLLKEMLSKESEKKKGTNQEDNNAE